MFYIKCISFIYKTYETEMMSTFGIRGFDFVLVPLKTFPWRRILKRFYVVHQQNLNKNIYDQKTDWLFERKKNDSKAKYI